MRNEAFLVLAVIGSTATAIQAGPIAFDSVTCLNSFSSLACTGGNLNIWNTGDFLSQTFTGTGLSSIQELDLNLFLFNNLTLGHSDTWNITVNSVLVGSLSYTGPGLGSYTYMNTLNFAPISGVGSGTDYTITFTVPSPGVPGLNGTLGLLAGSTGFLRDVPRVPEPSTLSLVGLALAGLGVRTRLFKRKH